MAHRRVPPPRAPLSHARPTSSARDPVQPPVEVIYLPMEEVQPDPRNARLHSKRQIRQIARSIETFGFNVPVLVDRDGKVVAGHGRVLACQLLGWTKVPAIRLEHLSAAQTLAFQIADNRLTEISTWDERLLAVNLKDLAVADLDFSIEATGFEMAEIELQISSLDAPEEDEDPDDELLDLPQHAVSRLGDLWIAGDHRVMCGNALSRVDYTALLAGDLADIVFTDPPYNVRVDGHVGGKGKTRHREFAMASGEMSSEDFTSFLRQVCTNLSDHARDGSIHYICMDWRHLPELLVAAQVYAELKNICVWSKTNAGMGSLYRSQHELVLVYKKGAAAHVNNVQLGRFGRYRSNVWSYPGANSFGRKAGDEDLLALHPTVKPVRMVEDALLDCSNRNDVVLDPFLGSGTTLLAAQRCGRRCRALELDPLYVDTAVRRWQLRTGQQARLVATGQTFDDVERERMGHVSTEGATDE